MRFSIDRLRGETKLFRVRPTHLLSPLAASFALLPAPRAGAQVDVLTQHYDNARTGLNAKETILTPQNVNSSTFGLLFSQPLDGAVYAQPLIVSNFRVGNARHNVAIVVTEHDSVYALDADSNTGLNGGLLWQRNFTDPAHGVTTIPGNDACAFTPEIGITATPVVDRANGVLYVSVATKENGKYFWKLHALNLHNGAELAGSPVNLTGSVAGWGDGAAPNGTVAFDPLVQVSRSGLLLLNGVVYVAFCSPCDIVPYHGWVFGVTAAPMKLKYVFCTTPNGLTAQSGYPLGAGGIWMAGNGPAADSTGAIYAETGNGSFDAAEGNGADYGDSFIKLVPDRLRLRVKDYFTPYNQQNLDDTDWDLGSGGCTVLPDSVGSATHPHLLVGCGKEGRIFLIDRDHMGKFHPGDDRQIVQNIPGGVLAAWSSPAYWNGNIYFAGVADYLKQYTIKKGQLSTTPVSQSTNTYGYPGSTPTISSAGKSNGIVWLVEDGNGYTPVLHAHDATNVANELYNSTQNAADAMPAGTYASFLKCTVANGKVYVAYVGGLSVYGNVPAR